MQLIPEKCFDLFLRVSSVHRIAHELHAHVVVAFLGKAELCDAGDAVRDLPELEHGGLLAVFMAHHVV